jgi:hypothetical protein
MPAWASGAWASGAWAGTAWAETGVTVPNVVGETQGDGTATLEADGFVVAVLTAYSSTVPAGAIISQSPSAGAEIPVGSTVTITVSLGDEPAGGSPDGDFSWHDYYLFKRKRRRKREKLEEELRQLAAALERAEKAQAIHEAPDASVEPVAHAPTPPSAELMARVMAAGRKAVEERTAISVRQFNRELRQLIENEEEEALVMLLLLDDED